MICKSFVLGLDFFLVYCLLKSFYLLKKGLFARNFDRILQLCENAINLAQPVPDRKNKMVSHYPNSIGGWGAKYTMRRKI